MTFRYRLALLSLPLLGPAFAAGQTQANSGPPSTGAPPVVLQSFVVSDQLDKAREDIVPSLGATSYELSASQIEVQSLGDNGSFNQVLLRTPSMAEDSYGQVHLRGEHANLQYRINDVVLPEGITGFGQELDIPFIKTLSLETGTLPAQYGYRTAGVVDIHTENGSSLGSQGAFGVFGGSYDTLRFSADGSTVSGPLTAFVTTSEETNGLGIENPAPTQDAIHDRNQQVRAFTDLSYILSPSSRISLLAGSSSASFQIPDNPGQTTSFALAGVPSFDSAALNENQDEYNDYAILAYQVSAGEFSGQVSAFSRYSLTHFTPDVNGDLMFNGVASEVHQDLISDGFEADGRWALSQENTLRAGGMLIASNANTRTNTAVFPTDAEGNQSSDVPYWIQDDKHKLGWLYGVYVQDEWKPLSGLTVNYGLRADESDAYVQEGQLSPRLNIVYQFTSSFSGHAGYARYFTPPPVELTETPDLAKFDGTTNQAEVQQNTPIRSERSNYVDVGFSWKATPDLSFDLDTYDKTATNQIDEGQFGAALIFATFNYQVGHIYGANLSANYSHGGFSAYANVAPGRATGQNITSGQWQFSADELSYIETHEVFLDHDQALTGSAGVSYQFSDTTLLADFLYGSGLRSGFANTDHVPEYHPVNLGAEHRFSLGGKKALTVRLDITNIFDEVYELRDGSGIGVFAPQYGARRGFYGSVKYAF